MTSSDTTQVVEQTDHNTNNHQQRIPEDLYIPPDALVVILEAFEGPLDLLLYLIRRQNLDILDIPVAEVTRQYMAYIDMMQSLKLELAGDYLVMSATLAAIKSRMMLPRADEQVDEEEDPRAVLMRQLQEYEVFKKAAENLDALPRLERDTFVVNVPRPTQKVSVEQPEIELRELVAAFAEVLERSNLRKPHGIEFEKLSVRERMSDLLDKLRENENYMLFIDLFEDSSDRQMVVVTFLALLELLRNGLATALQHGSYEPILVSSAA